MKVRITNNKLRKSLETERERVKAFGPDMAKKIALRITALEEAESLETFWPPKSLPERCHELQGDRDGTFSMDLKHPFRILFKPVQEEEDLDRSKEFEGEPKSRKQGTADEQERWRAIKTVDITSIEDTHG